MSKKSEVSWRGNMDGDKMKLIIELNSLLSIENVENSETEIKVNLSDYSCVINIEDLKTALRKMTAK